MICEGKRAKVIGCKKAETVEPVSAVVHSKSLRREKVAAVSQVNMIKQQKKAVVCEINPSVEEKDADVRKLQESHIMPKEISCRNVSSDITLQKLFHSKEK